MARFDTGCPCCRDDFYDYDEWIMQRVKIVEHPLAQDALARLRGRGTSPDVARSLHMALGATLFAEATRDLELKAVEIETSRGKIMVARTGRAPVLAAIGADDAALAEGALVVAPAAEATVDILRDDFAPPDLAGRRVVLLEAANADGAASISAIRICKNRGATDLHYACALATWRGIEALRCAHPDVAVLAVVIDADGDVAADRA